MFRHFTRRVTNSVSRSWLGSSARFNVTERANVTLLEQLSAEFDGANYVKSVMNDENLKNVKIEEWRKLINTLTQYNFDSETCFKIIKKYPPILKVPVEDLNDCLGQWHSCYMDVSHLLICQPVFLTVEVDEICQRLPYFSSICKNNQTLINFLIACPSVMFEDWEVVKWKINYLVTNLKVPHVQIFKSTVLNYPTTEIKVRFGLLKKCGVYTVKNIAPHKVNKYDKTVTRNPTLKEIFSEENYFIYKLAEITREEYESYKEMVEVDGESDEEVEDSDEE